MVWWVPTLMGRGSRYWGAGGCRGLVFGGRGRGGMLVALVGVLASR